MQLALDLCYSRTMPDEKPALPKHLYHGTSERVARLSLSEGLIPRGSRKGNWNHTVASGKDRVYLTDAYAPYFANAATSGEEDESHAWGIVRLETSLLDTGSLLPDEDFLEQAGRGRDGVTGTMAQRTRKHRTRARRLGPLWSESLRGLGTCAHMGRIPAEAVSAIALFRPASNPYVASMALDPSIVLLNYAIMGSRYRALTQWFFGPVSPGLLVWPTPVELLSEGQLVALGDRSGLTVIGRVP